MTQPGFWELILRRSGEKERNTGSNPPKHLAICNPRLTVSISTPYTEKSRNSQKRNADFKPEGDSLFPIAGNALFDKGFRAMDVA